MICYTVLPLHSLASIMNTSTFGKLSINHVYNFHYIRGPQDKHKHGVKHAVLPIEKSTAYLQYSILQII